MRPISAGERARMQAAQIAAMPDRCTLLHPSHGAEDGYGYPQQTWVAGETFACGLGEQRRSEVMGGAQVGVRRLALRLPFEAAGVVGRVDRVQVTHRFGEALAQPAIYEIVGGPHVGPSGVLIDVEAVGDV